jgi:hypothetical protein
VRARCFGASSSALDERLVDDYLGRDMRQFAPLPGLHCFRMAKFRCIRSTPTEMQSIRENDFQCLANPGTYTPIEHTRAYPVGRDYFP